MDGWIMDESIPIKLKLGVPGEAGGYCEREEAACENVCR